ncbi:MAG TPA: diaminopimelate epimerase [bacterium]
MDRHNALKFAKLSATGNDFILFDNRDGKFSGNEHEFFRQICQRRQGIGADGILLIGTSDRYHFSLTYYNSDGHIGEMCGNGARAAAYYSVNHKLSPAKAEFDVLGVAYQAIAEGDWVKLFMPPPVEIREMPGVIEEPGFQEGGYLNVGVPHYVLFVGDVAKIDVEKIGKKYRYHQAFQPWGTNVNFIEILNQSNLKIRTYERGVEQETLACGTGTISAAILAKLQKNAKLPVTVHAPGGDLRVDFDDDMTKILLEGQVKIVYYGQLPPGTE